MGFTGTALRFLCTLRKDGVEFGNTLMLGRQQLMVGKKEYDKILKDYGGVLNNTDELSNGGNKNSEYAEKFLSALGCTSVQSMDASKYEGASIIHDLNRKVPEDFKEKWNVIIDGGTTEHIFNYPIAIKNIMNMIGIGGYYIGMLPMNCFSGHGFYMFSPSLFIQLFSLENGFSIKGLYVYCENKERKLYKIPIEDLRERIQFNPIYPTLIYVVAQKTKATPDNICFQCQTYLHTWEESLDRRKKLLSRVIDSSPAFIRMWSWRVRTIRTGVKLEKVTLK